MDTSSHSLEVISPLLVGMVYPNNSGNTTPNGSFTRNLSRESGYMDSGISSGWKVGRVYICRHTCGNQ